MIVQYNVFYKNLQPANSGILLENKSNKCIHKPNHFCRESVAFVTFIRVCVVWLFDYFATHLDFSPSIPFIHAALSTIR